MRRTCAAHRGESEGFYPSGGFGRQPNVVPYRLTLFVYPLALPRYSTPFAIDAASNEPSAIVVAFSPFTSQVITPLLVSSITFCP